jgi:hypothetical protein
MTAVTFTPPLDVQGVAQPQQPPLARVVRGGVRPRALGGRGDDVHDVAPSPRAHEREGGARHQEGPAQVHAEDAIPVRRPQRLERHGEVRARVVDEHVEGAELRDRLVHDLARGPLVGDVETRAHRLAARRPHRVGDGLGRRGPDVSRDDDRSRLSERPAQRGAETAAAPGDQRHAPGELGRHHAAF